MLGGTDVCGVFFEFLNLEFRDAAVDWVCVIPKGAAPGVPFSKAETTVVSACGCRRESLYRMCHRGDCWLWLAGGIKDRQTSSSSSRKYQSLLSFVLYLLLG